MQIVISMEEEKKEEHHHIVHEGIAHRNPNASPSKKPNLWIIFLALILVLGISLIFLNIQIFSLNKELKLKVQKTAEASKPANIQLTSIRNSKCNVCSDIAAAISSIKGLKVNVTKENTLEFDSKEAKGIISKYDIENVPAVVVTGEIDKMDSEGFTKKDDALLFSGVLPPYTNAATGKVEGRVTVTILKDKECLKCDDLDALTSQIKAAGIRIYSEKNISSDSTEGKAVVGKYKIDFVPSLILSEDAGVYGIIQNAWLQIGTKENDGSYVLRTVYPPYINLTTGELKGLVKITYLTDRSCAECYNVSLHKQILESPQSFGIALDSEETYDISDAKGKELMAKYNITSVPTVILSNGVNVYPTKQAMKQFFTGEIDGSYVFRSPEVLGAYKDTSTGNIVRPQQQNTVSEAPQV